jgi:hypothetical protein
VDDLERICKDYGALAEIAETLDSSYEYVQSRINPPEKGVPDNLLEYLGREKSLPLLTIEQARRLWAWGGHRRARATEELIRSILDLDKIDRDPDSVLREIGGEPNLWLERQFQERLLTILASAPLPPRFLQYVESHVASFDSDIRLPRNSAELRKSADYYVQNRYRGIAEALCNGASQSRECMDAVAALKNRNSGAACWGQIAQIAPHCDDRGVVQDPLGGVLEVLQKLRAVEWETLDRDEAGWSTFREAIRSQPGLLYDIGGRVPALHVATFLASRSSLGVVAVGLLRALRQVPPHSSWWKAFFDTLSDCPRRLPRDRFDDNPKQAILRVCGELGTFSNFWAARYVQEGIGRFATQLATRHPRD